PLHPLDRLRRILSVSNSRVILTSKEAADKIGFLLEGEASGSEPVISEIAEVLRQMEAEDGPFPDSAPGNLAYVIFTSGATGTPKGAMIEHRGMLNHLYAKINSLSLEQADTIAETASQSFDISVWQFLTDLLLGGKVHIVDEEKKQAPSAL